MPTTRRPARWRSRGASAEGRSERKRGRVVTPAGARPDDPGDLAAHVVEVAGDHGSLGRFLIEIWQSMPTPRWGRHRAPLGSASAGTSRRAARRPRSIFSRLGYHQSAPPAPIEIPPAWGRRNVLSVRAADREVPLAPVPMPALIR